MVRKTIENSGKLTNTLALSCTSLLATNWTVAYCKREWDFGW